MAIGMVGYSGLTTRDEAPNSPREMVKAKMAAERLARPTIGQSTVIQTRGGEAPSTAAACLSLLGMDASAGCRLRMTNGKAIMAWAIGTRSGEENKRNSV